MGRAVSRKSPNSRGLISGRATKLSGQEYDPPAPVFAPEDCGRASHTRSGERCIIPPPAREPPVSQERCTNNAVPGVSGLSGRGASTAGYRTSRPSSLYRLLVYIAYHPSACASQQHSRAGAKLSPFGEFRLRGDLTYGWNDWRLRDIGAVPLIRRSLDRMALPQPCCV